MYRPENEELTNPELMAVCEQVSLTITDDEVKRIEASTRNQSKSTAWFIQRAGDYHPLLAHHTYSQTDYNAYICLEYLILKTSMTTCARLCYIGITTTLLFDLVIINCNFVVLYNSRLLLMYNQQNILKQWHFSL